MKTAFKVFVPLLLVMVLVMVGWATLTSGPAPGPEPATFTTGALTVTPTEVEIGEAVNSGTFMVRSPSEPREYQLLQSWGSRGSGDGQFNRPCGVAVDAQEQVYVIDTNRVQKLTADGRFLTQWITSSPPNAIAIDASGYVYVAESSNDSVGLIEKYTAEGGLVNSWEYEGCEYKRNDGTVVKYSRPGGIAVFGEYVYLGNNSNGSIDKFTTDGELVDSWPNLRRCCGFLDVAVDKQGNVYVAELGAFQVKVFDPSGSHVRSWGKQGTGAGDFCPCCNPVHVYISPEGNMVFTAEKSTPRIQVFTTNGQHIRVFGEGLFSKACSYMDLAVGPSGKVYVVDDASCCIRVFG